jgi:hypothetical protein
MEPRRKVFMMADSKLNIFPSSIMHHASCTGTRKNGRTRTLSFLRINYVRKYKESDLSSDEPRRWLLHIGVIY